MHGGLVLLRTAHAVRFTSTRRPHYSMAEVIGTFWVTTTVITTTTT